MKVNRPGSLAGDGPACGEEKEGWGCVWQLFAGQRQARQHGCVGIEDEDAHIGLAGQFKDLCQVVRHALAAVLLPKLLGGDLLDVLQVLAVQGVEISLTPIAGL
jgi:hypothetical protein